MSIRVAAAGDAAAIATLEAAAFPVGGWSGEQVRAELDAPSRRVLVDVRDGAVVGWAVLLDTDPADVLRVAVAPEARGRGVARTLLDALLGQAGDRPVLLEVAADNAAALALYAAAGFLAIDRRSGYYGTGRDALVLRRAPPGNGSP